MENTTEKKKPEWSLKYGTVQGAVWKDEKEANGEKFTVRNVTIKRDYKKDGQWVPTNSFRERDLPIVTLILQKAHEHILKAKEQDREMA